MFTLFFEFFHVTKNIPYFKNSFRYEEVHVNKESVQALRSIFLIQKLFLFFKNVQLIKKWLPQYFNFIQVISNVRII